MSNDVYCNDIFHDIGDKLNCPNCAAPIEGDTCKFCGARFVNCLNIGEHPFYLAFKNGSVNGGRPCVAKVWLRNVTINSRIDSDCYLYADNMPKIYMEGRRTTEMNLEFLVVD